MALYSRYYLQFTPIYPFFKLYSQNDIAISLGEELTGRQLTDIKKVIKALTQLKGEYTHVVIVSNENINKAVQYSIINNDACILEVPVEKDYFTPQVKSLLEHIFTHVLKLQRDTKSEYIRLNKWNFIKNKTFVLYVTGCKNLDKCHHLLMKIAKNYFSKDTSFTIKLFYVVDHIATKYSYLEYGVRLLLLTGISYLFFYWLSPVAIRLFASIALATFLNDQVRKYLQKDAKQKRQMYIAFNQTLHKVIQFIVWASVVIIAFILIYIIIVFRE